MVDPSPFLVTLGFDPATFARLDGLRRRYFPSDRNVVPAHVSLFHQLPAEEEVAIDEALARSASSSAPIPLRFDAPFRLGSGFALSVAAPGLKAIHDQLSGRFAPWLMPQDRQPFRPHVTIMNKADRLDASLAFSTFRDGWEAFSGIGDSLLLWRYRGGPWEPSARYDFSGPTP